MSFGSAPSPPDPSLTSNTQQQYNVDAAKSQQGINEINQSNPYGSFSYVPDSSSPSGYRLDTSFSAPQQALYNTQTGTQQTAGNTAQSLLKNAQSMYSSPYDLNAASSGTAGLLNKWSQQYVQPIFDQQSSNLEAQLRNQGLTPGSEAYNNAKNLLARNQGDVTNQYLQQNQGQAFGQALQQYQLPLQTVGSLFGMSGPTGPTMANTPTATVQPPNYQQATQANYAAQLQNYQAQQANYAKLGAAGIGLLGAPFTGGASLGLAGGLGSIFGGNPSYGGGSSLFNAYGGSSANPLAGLQASDYGVGY